MYVLQNKDGDVKVTMNGELDNGQSFRAEMPVLSVSSSKDDIMEVMHALVRAVMRTVEEKTGQKVVKAELVLPIDSGHTKFAVYDVISGEERVDDYGKPSA